MAKPSNKPVDKKPQMARHRSSLFFGLWLTWTFIVFTNFYQVYLSVFLVMDSKHYFYPRNEVKLIGIGYNLKSAEKLKILPQRLLVIVCELWEETLGHNLYFIEDYFENTMLPFLTSNQPPTLVFYQRSTSSFFAPYVLVLVLPRV